RRQLARSHCQGERDGRKARDRSGRFASKTELTMMTLKTFKARLRTPNFKVAQSEAQANRCAFGICVLDGWFYVGQRDELEAGPVLVSLCDDYSPAPDSTRPVAGEMELT